MRLLSLLFGALLVFSPALAGVKRPMNTKRAVQVVSPSKRKYYQLKRIRNRPRIAKPLIILDSGHGGKDPGARVHALLEKRLTLTTTLFLKRALENLGYRVILTRSRDVRLSLERRVRIANRMDGTLFVSIHFNSASNKTAKGVEVYYYPSKTDLFRSKESKNLANSVLYQIVDHTAMQSRGVKKGNLFVLRETQMPAILIEGGFMTHPGEFNNLKNRDFLNALADGVCRGIDRYLKS